MNELDELRLALAATEDRLQATYESLAIQSSRFAELRAELDEKLYRARALADGKVKRAEAARDRAEELLKQAYGGQTWLG